ncbi:microsomal signal peptidase 12 kDa subunit, partial [Backusella circina FSU 941]
DFSGQKLSDQLLHVLLTAFGVISLVVGYSMQSLQMLLIIFAGGLLTTALVVIPPWPMYNKHPQKWL